MVLRKLKYSCYVALTVVSALLSNYAYAAEENNKPDPKLCVDYADPIRVTVGGTEFHIPDKYKPEFTDEIYEKEQHRKICVCRTAKDVEAGILQRSYCQKKDDPSPELNRIFFRQVFPSYKNEITFPLSRKLDISIDGYSEPVPPQKFFCSEKQRIDANHDIFWKQYPKASDFYEYVMRYGGIYYYSDKHRLWGMPVIINCSKMVSTISRAAGRKCSIHASLGSRNSLLIRFNDGYLPPDEWDETIKAIEEFLHSMMPDTTAKPEFISCNPSNNKEK